MTTPNSVGPAHSNPLPNACYDLVDTYTDDIVNHVILHLHPQLRYHALACNTCRRKPRLTVGDLVACFGGRR